MILEVCAFNIQSCFIAQSAGAARIEFCADPLQGGTTPSSGAIRYALAHIDIPVFPMIRPRGGDFIYDSHELDIMKKDVLYCRDIGCQGIATGLQLPDRSIDIENLKRITEWAYPMEVTCHKAFDATTDPFTALEDVINAGCTRILTSGLAKTAMDGTEVLSKLVAAAGSRIIVMPGGGVRSSNIKQLVAATGAGEYHSSCITNRATIFTADEGEVRAIVAGLGGSGC
jgi:copper homeostasis protein